MIVKNSEVRYEKLAKAPSYSASINFNVLVPLSCISIVYPPFEPKSLNPYIHGISSPTFIYKELTLSNKFLYMAHL